MKSILYKTLLVHESAHQEGGIHPPPPQGCHTLVITVIIDRKAWGVLHSLLTLLYYTRTFNTLNGSF